MCVCVCVCLAHGKDCFGSLTRGEFCSTASCFRPGMGNCKAASILLENHRWTQHPSGAMVGDCRHLPGHVVWLGVSELCDQCHGRLCEKPCQDQGNSLVSAEVLRKPWHFICLYHADQALRGTRASSERTRTPHATPQNPARWDGAGTVSRSTQFNLALSRIFPGDWRG